MNKNKTKTYTTYNLNLASVFVALGLTLQDIEKNVSGKSLFIFNQSKQLNETIEKYWRKELLIEPQQLFDSAKFIKNRLYSEV